MKKGKNTSLYYVDQMKNLGPYMESHQLIVTSTLGKKSMVEAKH